MPGGYCAWQSEESPQAVARILDEYYELRGWEKSLGLPTEQRFIELGLQDIGRQLREEGKIKPR